MNHGDVNRAMRNLMRNGMSGDQGQRISGLRELRERLREMQQQKLQQYNLESAMDDIKERLQDVLDTERSGIDRRLSEAREEFEASGDNMETLQPAMDILEQRAQRNLETLDQLPDSTAGQMRELSEYDFMDPEAREKFDELMDMLRQQMMQNFFQGMKDAIENMSAGDMQRMQEMVQALNQMFQDRGWGRSGLRRVHGAVWAVLRPDRPASLDELIEQLQQQMASMQSMMNSMSPQMRDDLMDMLQSSMDPSMSGSLRTRVAHV